MTYVDKFLSYVEVEPYCYLDICNDKGVGGASQLGCYTYKKFEECHCKVYCSDIFDDITKNVVKNLFMTC